MFKYNNISINSLILISITMLCSSSYGDKYTLVFNDFSCVETNSIALADIISNKADIPEKVLQSFKKIVIGQSAPPGFSRFFNTSDLDNIIKINKISGINDYVHNKRISITTFGIKKTIGEFADTLTTYINNHNNFENSQCSVLIENPQDSVVIFNNTYTYELESARKNEIVFKGATSIKIIIHQENQTSKLLALCRVHITTPVLIATEKIEKNSTISPLNSKLQLIDITNFNYNPITNYLSIKNGVCARTIYVGTIIHEKLIAKKPDIKTGEQVLIVFLKDNFLVTIPGIARESGVRGENIVVENSNSHKLIRTKIIEKAKVSPQI